MLNLLMVKNPSTPAPMSEFEYRLKAQKIDAAVTITKNFLKYAALVGCAVCFYLSVRELAGKTTLAQAAVHILGDLKVNRGIVALLGFGGVLYGAGERALRRRAIKRLAREKNAIEKLLDQKRSSSGLTDTGETNPEDKT